MATVTQRKKKKIAQTQISKWFAAAVKATEKGHDFFPEKTAEAQRNLKQAGLID